MRFAVCSRMDPYSKDLCRQLEESLSAHPEWTKDPLNPEIVVCIGGDGTLLRAIHKYIDQLETTLFTALHTGTLGFFTDYTHDQIQDLIYDLISGDYKEETSSVLEAQLDNGEVFYALNEIRLGSFLNSVTFDIFINGEFFETTCGSGVCISTQAGSTAANRSLGGAVVDNGLSVLQMTEITPVSHKNHHSLKSPYIMRDDRVVTIHGDSIQKSELYYDHLACTSLASVGKVTVKMSDKSVRFARFKPYSYLKRLKNLY